MTNSQVTQAEINNILWKAADTFRGTVDSSEYKNYILSMLFVKYVSDVWEDIKEELEKKYNGDKERLERAMSRERFNIPSKAQFDYLFEHRSDNNIGELINSALELVENHNKEKLEGVFRNINFNSESILGRTKERNQRLKHLLEDFNDPKLDLRPSKIGIKDIIGNSYEYLIGEFASDAGKKGGEFYTPAEVSLLIAKLLNPKKGDQIYDPACGSGSLLIKVASQISGTDFSLYGQESNSSTFALCRMNMFLHNIDSADIKLGDTLNDPQHIENGKLQKFDIVVANPPFSLDKWGASRAESDPYNRYYRGVPPKSKGDYAFITHMVESINDKGKVGVVVPHGVLFRGSSEGRIRQAFLEENIIEAVIGLPQNLFYGTGIPAAIIIFNKDKKTDKVLFIDASREYKEGSNQNALRDEDIEKIVKTYVDFKTIDKYSYVAGLEEIKENDYNLNIPRYVDTFEPEPEVNIKAMRKEIKEIEKQVEESKKKMERYLDELGF